MGKKTIIKLYFRSFLFISFTILLAYDMVYHQATLSKVFSFKIFDVTMSQILWFYLLVEMLMVFIPRFNNYSYSGKNFLRHYEPVKTYNLDKLNQYTKQNNKRALYSGLVWILFNLPFAILFFLGFVNQYFFYWLFFTYYFLDTVCINIFCPFHLFIQKNKCCNECRIYNWGHIMYCTPLFFVPNFNTYSLSILSILIFIQWELAVYKHPERFSSLTNQNLQCHHCTYSCRYQRHKSYLNQFFEDMSEKIYDKFFNKKTKSEKI